MFSVQHLTAFLNLLKHPNPPPVLYPFSTHQVLSFPYPFTKHHRPILTSIQHLAAQSLPLYSTSPPVPCQYTTPTACLEAWQPTPYPIQHARSLPLYDTHSLPLYNTSFPILYPQYNTSAPVPYPFQLHQVCHGQLDSGQRTSFEGHYLPVVFSCPCKVQIDCSSAAAVVIQGKSTPAELTKFWYIFYYILLFLFLDKQVLLKLLKF